MSRDYRVYLLNEAGHVVDAVNLRCDTDGEALLEAKRHARGRGWELWIQDRLVHVDEGIGQASLRV